MNEGPFENPFENAIAGYAMRFAQPVFYGESPVAAYRARLANGTATLVKLGGRYLAITCHHVLQGYRAELARDPKMIFQIGRLPVMPLERIVSGSAELDLVVLDLTQDVRETGLMKPGSFAEPHRWPPGEVSADDILAFTGFPGVWRDQLEVGYLRFYSVNAGTADVKSLGEHHFYTSLDISECQVAFNEGLVLGSLGGLSGGPVFVWRRGPVLTAELVGFAIEYQEDYDLLYVRRSTCVREDGTLALP